MVENNTNILTNMVENISNYAPWIGFFGTCILFFFQNINLTYILIFIIGFFINSFINKFIKKIINDKRPVIHNKSNENRMPSGHTQSVFYTIMFLSTLLFNNIIKGIEVKIWICITILLGGLTSYNCIKGGYHTIDQVIVGIVLGNIIGYSFTLVNNRSIIY